MFAVLIAADRPTPPDPSLDRPAVTAAAPSRSARLLGVLRKLIDYGKELAGTLRRHNCAPYRTAIAFGTTEFALILQRITLGLHRAAALEARIVRSAARLDLDAAPCRVASPRAARPKPPPQPDPATRRTEDADPRLTHLPTPEAIAADVRRRPIGAVLEDICRDLGILPSHPLWRELQFAIIDHGGNPPRLLKRTFEESFSRPPEYPHDSVHSPLPPSFTIAPATRPP